MNKKSIAESLLSILIIVLIAYTIFLWLTSPSRQFPLLPRQLFACAGLVWAFYIMFSKNSDDDWSGQL